MISNLLDDGTYKLFQIMGRKKMMKRLFVFVLLFVLMSMPALAAGQSGYGWEKGEYILGKTGCKIVMKEDMSAIKAYAGHTLQAETKTFNTNGGGCIAMIKGAKSISAQELNSKNYEAVVQQTPANSTIFQADEMENAYSEFKKAIFEKKTASYMEPIEVQLGKIKVYALMTMENIYFDNVMDCCTSMAVEDQSALYWVFYHRNVSFNSANRQLCDQQLDELYAEMAAAIGEVLAIQ